MNIVDTIRKQEAQENRFEFNVGDTVRIAVKIVEGDTERIQNFQGTVIARRGSGIEETFTVRRVQAGQGVERVFPINSPRIAGIEVVRRGMVAIRCTAKNPVRTVQSCSRAWSSLLCM